MKENLEWLIGVLAARPRAARLAVMLVLALAIIPLAADGLQLVALLLVGRW